MEASERRQGGKKRKTRKIEKEGTKWKRESPGRNFEKGNGDKSRETDVRRKLESRGGGREWSRWESKRKNKETR